MSSGTKNASKVFIKDDMELESSVVNICHQYNLFTAQQLVDEGREALMTIGLSGDTITKISKWIENHTGLFIGR